MRMRQNSEAASRGIAKVIQAAAMLVLLCIATSVYAQTTGTISGTVTDQSNAVIPGAHIALKNETTGDVRHTLSNGSGYFSFGSVAPGAYDISISAKGFKAW